MKKPTDAFEFIGVAEPSADVPGHPPSVGPDPLDPLDPLPRTMPLHKNRKGKGWFWGGDPTEAFASASA